MRNRFDVKDPADWSEVAPGEVLAFDAPVGRRVRLSVNTSVPASVFVGRDEDMADRVLLGHGEGLFDVAYSAEAETFVSIVPQGDGFIFVAGHSPSHVVQKTDELVLTTLEPQGRRNSEYDRMLMLMRYNERRRDEKLAEELRQVRAAVAARSEATSSGVEEAETAETVSGQEATSATGSTEEGST